MDVDVFFLVLVWGGGIRLDFYFYFIDAIVIGEVPVGWFEDTSGTCFGRGDWVGEFRLWCRMPPISPMVEVQ